MYRRAGVPEEQLYTLQHLYDTMIKVRMPELTVAENDIAWAEAIISASNAFNHMRKGKGVDLSNVKSSVLPITWS